MKLALSISCLPVALAGISYGATLMPMTTVKIDTVVSTGPATPLVPLSISNGTSRASGAAMPTNGVVSGGMETSGSRSQAAEGPATSRQAPAREEGPSSNPHTAAREEPANRALGTPSSRTTRSGHVANAQGPAGDSKNVIAPEVVYADPGAFHFTAEAGYSSKHIWRGIDLAQFTSYNYASKGVVPNADSDVTFIGASATYKGFLFGVKYIETIDDTFNPFYNPYAATIRTKNLDSYSELDLSLNYTRMLVGNDILQGTIGVDFYYYPNDLFWGVSNQGMVYTRLSSPHFKWAQPFLELFYNFAIDSTGGGLAASTPNFRGASGSELVEGGGFEIGVNGGDRIFSNDSVSMALTYSISSFYKSGYQFCPDGFSQLSITIGAPVTIGANLTITPSVSYVTGLQTIPDNKQGTGANQVNFGGSNAEIWNSPGWLAGVKASWQF